MVEFNLPGAWCWSLLLVLFLIPTIVSLLRTRFGLGCLGLVICIALAAEVIWWLEPFYDEFEPRAEPMIIWSLCVVVPTTLGVIGVMTVIRRIERYASKYG